MAHVVGAGSEVYHVVSVFLNGLIAVEGDGVGLVGGAVGLHVGDAVRLPVAADGCAHGGISVAYGERAAVDGASGGGVVQCVVFWGFAKGIAECQLCALAPVVLDHVVAVAVAGEAQLIGHRGLDGDVVAKVNQMSSRDAGDGRVGVCVADGIALVATVVIAVGDVVVGDAGDAEEFVKVAYECTDAFR